MRFSILGRRGRVYKEGGLLKSMRVLEGEDEGLDYREFVRKMVKRR